MGKLVSMPMSEMRRMALLWQEEERAFQTVLAVLRESRRFDLMLKIDTFLKVRRRRIMTQLFAALQERRGEGGEPDAEPRPDAPSLRLLDD